VVHQSVINFGGNSPAIQNRLRVAQERHAAIIAGYLPRRDEPLIQEASEADLSDLDSEVGEAYVIYSSDEEGTEPVGVWSEYLPTLSRPVEPDHPPPFHLQHPWRRVPQPPDHPPPRVPRPPDHSQPSSSASTEHRNLANVIVSSNNPLLRRSQRFAKLHRGTQVFIGSTEPADQVPIYSNQQKRIVCLDYHQVLDRVRGGRNRPDLFLVDEALHPFVQRYLELLGRRFEVWVVSFCCSGYYRNRVKTNCNLPGVSRVILTSERAGRGGKLDAVRAQLTPECLQVALSLTTTGASIRSGLLHLVTAFARSLPELLFPGSQGLTELRIIRTSGLQLLDVPISASWLSTIVHKRRNILEL